MTLPVQPISAADIVRHAATPTPDMQALTQRFEKLMAADASTLAPAHAPSSTVSPSVSNAIHSLDESTRQLNEDMHRMIIDAPTMDMQTITAVNMELTLRTAISQTQLTVCSSVAKSGKEGLSTLMKNQ